MKIISADKEDKAIYALGQLLREARITAKIRQADLADKVGVSRLTIHRMEAGKGKRTAMQTWIAAFNAVGLLPELLEWIESVEINPFIKYNKKSYKKKRVYIK